VISCRRCSATTRSQPARSSLMMCIIVASSFALPRGIVAQQSVVTGTVVAASTLQPLEAVDVFVAGTSKHAQSDARGKFSLALDNRTRPLEFRRIGYRSVSRALNDSEHDLRIALTEAALQLDELVITGTAGATQSRALGNSVARLDATRVQNLAPAMDVQQMLNGRLPGVTILPYSGNAGTGGITKLRAASSITLSNEPLIMIDGIRVDNNRSAGPLIRQGAQVSRINDIPPEDIESIEIIKGPAAATLYGTEASRGVIQIITRQGREGPLRVQASMRYGAAWFMNPEGRLPTSFAKNPLTGALDSLNLYRQEEARGTPLFSTGHPKAYALSLSGGSKGIRYLLAGDYDRDEGAVDYNWRNRGGARANLKITPSEKLNVETNLGFVRNYGRLGQSAPLWDLMAQLVWGFPLARDLPTRGFFRTTPEAAATIESYAINNRFIGSGRIEYAPWKWLTQRLVIGADMDNETNSLLFPRDPAGAAGPFGPVSLGQKTVDRREVIYSTVDYSTSATLDLNSRLRSTTSLGGQYYARQTVATQSVGRDFPDPEITVVGGAATTTGSESRVDNKTAGVFLQQQVGWNNRRFFTAAVRADDNSAFGANFNFVVYPKLSASWILNEEPFWHVPFIGELKLRAAWGRAGQQPDAFAAVRSYSPATGPGDSPTLTPLNVGNPDLKPERAEELELGFDAGMWDGRVSLGLTYYRQRIDDAILGRIVAPSAGFPGTQLVNAGKTRTAGLELRLATPWYSTWGILYEFLRVVTHPRVIEKPWSIVPALEFVQAVLAAPAHRVLLETTEHSRVAAETFGQMRSIRGNLVHDSHTAILMREHGLTRIHTRDSDFRRFSFLEVVDSLD
jgi:TonB-dependent SusC/RagA subfamily outer membrane receptor